MSFTSGDYSDSTHVYSWLSKRRDATANAASRRRTARRACAPRASTKFSLTPGFGRSFQVTTPTKLAEDSPEDKYKAMIVTPDGTIIRIGGPEMKPETDPGWEERQAQRKVKRAREETPSSSSDSPAESPLGKALSSPRWCVARLGAWFGTTRGRRCQRHVMQACKQGQNDLAPYLHRTPGLLCTHKTLRRMLIRVREARREAAPPPQRGNARHRSPGRVRPLFMNSIQTHEFERN